MSFATLPNVNQPPATFDAAYTNELVDEKFDYDKKGKLIVGGLAASLMNKYPGSKWGNLIDGILRVLQRRVTTVETIPTLQAQGTNDGHFVGEIRTAPSGATYKCTVANPTTSLWRPEHGAWSSVDFGADPLGVTDGTAALIALFASIAAGDEVVIVGEVRVSSAVAVPNWCYVRGAGASLGIAGAKLRSYTNDHILLDVNTETIHISNLGFRGPGKFAGTDSVGIRLRRSSGASQMFDARFTNCWFTEFSKACVEALKLRTSHFANCAFENSDRAIYAADPSSAVEFEENVFTSCEFFSLGRQAIYFDNPSIGSDLLSLLRWNTFSGCAFQFCGTTTLPSDPPSDFAAVYLGQYVTGNVFSCCQFANQVMSDVYMTNNTDNTFSDCTHARIGRAVYYANGCSNLRISGFNISSPNYLLGTHGFAKSAIEIDVGCSNVSISGGRIHSMPGEGRHDYGVLVASGSNVRVFDTEISDHLLGEISGTLAPVRSHSPVRHPVYTDATRPAASTFPASTEIWNSDDNAPNYSDGTNWRDAAGSTT